MVDVREWNPQALRQIGVADTHVVLAWKEPQVEGPVLGYLVRDQQGRAAAFAPPGSSYVLLEGLVPGTSYRVGVSTLTENGWSGLSPTIWARTSGQRPKSPRKPRSKSSRSDEWGSLADYLEAVQHIPLLTPQEEHELAAELATGERGDAFWSFVLSNLRLVVHWARKSARMIDGTLLEIADLIQAGTEGLIKAVERFDASKGYKFSTYGTWWIRQAISREIPPMARAVYVPVHVWNEIETLRREVESVSSISDVNPDSVQQIADLLLVEPERVRFLNSLSQSAVSLEKWEQERSLLHTAFDRAADPDLAWWLPAFEGEEQIPPWRVEEAFSHETRDPTSTIEDSEAIADRVTIASILENLHLVDRDDEILRMRFGLGTGGREHTLEEIGEHFGLTRERVRQLVVASLAEIARLIEPNDSDMQD